VSHKITRFEVPNSNLADLVGRGNQTKMVVKFDIGDRLYMAASNRPQERKFIAILVDAEGILVNYEQLVQVVIPNKLHVTKAVSFNIFGRVVRVAFFLLLFDCLGLLFE